MNITKTYKAYADLSDYQFHFVKLTDDTTVNICSTKGEAAIGILQNAPSAAGEGAEVMLFGISDLVAGGSVTRLQQVTTDANGHGIIPDAAAQQVLARAIESADSSDIKKVLLNIGGGEAHAAEA